MFLIKIWYVKLNNKDNMYIIILPPLVRRPVPNQGCKILYSLVFSMYFVLLNTA